MKDQSSFMQSTTTARLFNVAVVFLCLASFSGCAVRKLLPYNHMCPGIHQGMFVGAAAGQCPHGCCKPQPATGEFEELGPVPAAVELPVMAPFVQEELDKLKNDNAAMRENLGRLDERLEAQMKTQRSDSESVVKVMRELVSELSAVKRELDDQSYEVSQVETRLVRHRDQSDLALSNLERQLNDLLSQYAE